MDGFPLRTEPKLTVLISVRPPTTFTQRSSKVHVTTDSHWAWSVGTEGGTRYEFPKSSTVNFRPLSDTLPSSHVSGRVCSTIE